MDRSLKTRLNVPTEVPSLKSNGLDKEVDIFRKDQLELARALLVGRSNSQGFKWIQSNALSSAAFEDVSLFQYGEPWTSAPKSWFTMTVNSNLLCCCRRQIGIAFVEDWKPVFRMA